MLDENPQFISLDQPTCVTNITIETAVLVIHTKHLMPDYVQTDEEGTHKPGIAYIIIAWNRHHPQTGSEPVCLPTMSR